MRGHTRDEAQRLYALREAQRTRRAPSFWDGFLFGAAVAFFLSGVGVMVLAAVMP